nr:uncharacterized protein LOC112274351 isoform X1 [Physcomitrium patens]|eukprot:XP_024359543.1 uncharacterized protein LOC112274351 isoform X1 [Physcomitrella patens]
MLVFKCTCSLLHLPVCDLSLPSPSLAVLVQALLKEVVAYTKIEKLWGIFVPRLIGYGTTNNGRVVFIATELIDGVELGEVAVTREVETAALEALAAVHACELLHRDVSLSNIMVVWGTKPTVRILDFGFSWITSNKKLQEAERVRLKRLFFSHMVEQRGKKQMMQDILVFCLVKCKASSCPRNFHLSCYS